MPAQLTSIKQHRGVVIRGKQAVRDRGADDLFEPDDTVLAGSLLDRIRKGRGLPDTASVKAVLVLLGIEDKRPAKAKAV